MKIYATTLAVIVRKHSPKIQALIISFQQNKKMKFIPQDGFAYYFDFVKNLDYQSLFTSKSTFTFLNSISEEKALYNAILRLLQQNNRLTIEQSSAPINLILSSVQGGITRMQEERVIRKIW